MAEYTPVNKINYDLFKQNYDPNLPYNEQSETIQQKYNEDLFNKYSGIASEEPKLGFFEKLGSGLESLFSAYGAEPDYVNPDLAEMLAQQNYQNTLAYTPMFSNRNRFKEDIIPERMIDAPMDLESTMAESILDKGITNRSLIGDLPNLNYRNYLSNLFNTNKTTQPDFINAPQDYYQPMAMRKDLGMDTSYGVASEPDVEQVESLTEKEPTGIEKLMKFVMPGSLFANLLSGILPQESPAMKAAKSFYRNQYGLTPGGSVASGLMKGYNPVSGGLLNMLTKGAFGKPPNVGLQRAYQQRINTIKNTLARKYADGDYSGTQLDEKLAELQRLKNAEQMAMEKPTIDKARETNRDVYERAAREGRLGPGGGFSTSGREGAFESRSGRGRQDF